jgi:hypothetical protein
MSASSFTGAFLVVTAEEGIPCSSIILGTSHCHSTTLSIPSHSFCFHSSNAFLNSLVIIENHFLTPSSCDIVFINLSVSMFSSAIFSVQSFVKVLIPHLMRAEKSPQAIASVASLSSSNKYFQVAS